jgi:hypothetical protein
MFQSEWLAQAEALKVLGLSRTQFWRLRRDRVILPMVHFHRTGRSRRAPMMVNVPACRLALRVHLPG